MRCFCILAFLLQIVKHLKAELSLEIFKNVNGTEVPVLFHSLRELAGTNLTLTCKLVVVGENDTSNYFDDQVSWGWKRKNVQFISVGDLKNLAGDVSKPLNQFLKESGSNQTTIPFYPLLPIDSRKYFCMSMKHKLFNIVKIKVIKDSKYNQLIKNHELLSATSELDALINSVEGDPAFHSKSSFACTNDMFMCNSRTSCIEDENVCDGKKDCNDGSDENVYLCGNDTCSGKRNCSNGRCILESMCDNYKNIQPSCCSESTNDLLQRGMSGVDWQNLQHEEQIANELLRAQENIQNIPKFEVLTMPNFNIEAYTFKPLIDVNKYSFNPKIDDRWTTSQQDYRTGKIILGITFVLVLVGIRCCLNHQIEKCRKKPTRLLLWRISTLTIRVPPNDENGNSPSNSSAQEVSTSNAQSDAEDLPPSYADDLPPSYTDDLPPSYDEAVVDVPQTTSLLT